MNQATSKETAEAAAIERLRESEARYRDLFTYASEGLLVLTTDGRIVQVNQAFADMHGYPPEQLQTMKIMDLDVLGSGALAERPEVVTTMRRGEPARFQAEHKHADGHTFPVAVTTSYISLGGVPHVVAFHRDISEEKAADAKLRESERQYHSLFESMNEGFCLHEVLLDPNGVPYDYVILAANPAFESIIGMAAKEVVGKRATVAYGVEVAPYLDVYAAVALSGKPTRFESHFVPMDKHFAITVFSPGKGRFATIFEDITARKRDEEALRQSRERFRSIVQNTIAGYFFIDKHGIIKDINPAWARLYGYDSVDEIIGHHFADIQKVEDVEAARTFVEGILRSDPRYCSGEFSRKCKDGSIGYHFFAARPVEIAGDTVGIEGFIVDSTAWRAAEDALQKREEKYRDLFNNAEVGMFRSRLDGDGFLDINDKFLRILGRTREESLGVSTAMLWADPGERDEMVRVLKAQGYVTNLEIRLNRKDGSIADCITSLRLYPEEGVFEGSIMDITERKRLEAALQNAQRLESLGLLAGGIAHDFNNLLHGIYAYVDLASETSTDADVRSYLTKATSTIERGRDLTRQLITFAKGGAPVRAVAHLFPFVRETAEFALSGSDVSCVFDVQDDLWPANYDKNQIGQVIDNVIINAKQAMPTGGRIEIRARNLSLGQGEHCVLQPGRYVKLSIRDQGIGIPKEMLSKVFDPFFTTKSAGHGLGLATSYSIVKRHGGAIEVESTQGEGSTFHVILPVGAGPAAPAAARRAGAFRGKGTFVVMDDQAVVRDASLIMLGGLGYEVICANDGQAAVECIARVVRSGGTVAGAILDLTVPGGMGGKDAVGRLRDMGLDIPVIAASGHAEDPVMASPREFGFVGSLAKPFTKTQLVALLEKL